MSSGFTATTTSNGDTANRHHGLLQDYGSTAATWQTHQSSIDGGVLLVTALLTAGRLNRKVSQALPSADYTMSTQWSHKSISSDPNNLSMAAFILNHTGIISIRVCDTGSISAIATEIRKPAIQVA